MRLVDADKLELDAEWDDLCEWYTSYSQFQINAAPTIDAVEVVRCRDCVAHGCLSCPMFKFNMNDDFFCAFGRKEEGECNAVD